MTNPKGGLLGSAASTLRELGALDATLYWTDRVLSRLTRGWLRIRRYIFVVQPLRQPALRKGRPDTKLVVRSFVAGDPVQRHFPVPADVIRRRLEQGSTCLVAELNGDFAGYIWLHAGLYWEDEVRCIFEPWPAQRVSWDFDIYIVPHLRATRTFGRLWQAAEQHLLSRGFTHSASRISAYNVVSIRSHVRSGATISGSATFITLGRWQVTIAPGTAARVVSFTSDAVPPHLRICGQLN